MTLIEGLGDEVTLVLGSFIIIVVLLLAWLSTHTEELPGIPGIIIEFRRRTDNALTGPPQEVEISQSSREGIPSLTPDSASTSTDVSDSLEQSTVGSSSNVGTGDPQRSEDSITETVSSPLASSDSRLAEQQGSTGSGRDTAVNSRADLIPTSNNLSDSSPSQDGDAETVSKESTNNDNDCVVSNATAADVLDSEGLRRRRVHYFQSPSGAGENGDGAIPPTETRRDNTVSMSSNNGNQTPAHSPNCDQSQNSISNERERLEPSAVSEVESQSAQVSGQQQQSPPTNQADSLAQEAQGNDSLRSRIHVKLKYMNETQRSVYAYPGDTIGDFRRAHFQPELADNKWVRFIFNGQDLRDDARTLQACNIENNCTMHCLVTSRQRPTERVDPAIEDDDDVFLGSLMYPLFTLLLLVVWYFRIFYRQYFSALSTVCLVGISFLLGLSYLSSVRASAPVLAATQNAPQEVPGSGAQNNHPHSD